jgi:hypothetical protein
MKQKYEMGWWICPCGCNYIFKAYAPTQKKVLKAIWISTTQTKILTERGNHELFWGARIYKRATPTEVFLTKIGLSKYSFDLRDTYKWVGSKKSFRLERIPKK